MMTYYQKTVDCIPKLLSTSADISQVCLLCTP